MKYFITIIFFLILGCTSYDDSELSCIVISHIGAANRPHYTKVITTQGKSCPINNEDYPDEILMVEASDDVFNIILSHIYSHRLSYNLDSLRKLYSIYGDKIELYDNESIVEVFSVVTYKEYNNFYQPLYSKLDSVNGTSELIEILKTTIQPGDHGMLPHFTRHDTISGEFFLIDHWNTQTRRRFSQLPCPAFRIDTTKYLYIEGHWYESDGDKLRLYD